MPIVRIPGAGKTILKEALESLAGKVGRVGWFSSAHYPSGLNIAYIAAIHEFGYAPKNIPPRMGLRTLIKEKQQEWTNDLYVLGQQVFKGNITGSEMLIGIGGVAEGAIRKQISNVIDPPLAEGTLAERARRLGIKREELTGTGAKPLVEPTLSKKEGGGSGGLLLSHVSHDVSTTAGKNE